MTNIQYGLRFPEGHITAYPSKKAAEAAQERMRRWPTTKFATLIERDYHVSDWRPCGDEG